MGLHKDVEEANLHESKGVSTALANLAYITDGIGSGTFAAYKPTNVVYVNKEADFPAASGGVITLAADTCYTVGAAISTTNRFALAANNKITCGSIEGPLLTYTGTGAMFTGVNVNFQLDQARLDCPNGTVMDLTGTGGTGFLRFDKTRVENCAKLADFTDMIGVIFGRCALLNMTQGIEFFGTIAGQVFSCEKLRTTTSSATYKFVEFNALVYSTIEIDDVIFQGVAGAVAISGMASSGNVATDKLAIVSSCEFDGNITPLAGITNTDIRWEFTKNSGLADSTKAGDTYITSTQLVTIGTIGVFVVINGGSWSSDIANRFTASASGRLTYISEVDATFLISGTATVDKTTGGSDVLEMRIAKNGTTLAKSGTFTQSADPTTVMSQALITMTKDDYIELFVANNTSTGNIDVNLANLTARTSG